MVFMGMTEDASAAVAHTVTVKGFMLIRDHDDWGVSPQRTFDIDKSVTLRHGDKPVILRTERCVDEVRGVLDVLVQLDRFDAVWASPNLKLYEGDSCDTKDLDGEQPYPPNLRIPLGESHTWETWVVNGEFASPDLVRTKYTVTHNGPPNAPSNIKATTPPVMLVCAFLRAPCKQKSVSLTWKDNANNETAYEVRNVTLNKITRVTGNSTKFTWPGLDRQIKHCFQVRAVNSFGASPWSPPFSLVALFLGDRRPCA
nr:fibronectin type III domain-containing protein [Streptomyces cinnamoneus]